MPKSTITIFSYLRNYFCLRFKATAVKFNTNNNTTTLSALKICHKWSLGGDCQKTCKCFQEKQTFPWWGPDSQQCRKAQSFPISQRSGWACASQVALGVKSPPANSEGIRDASSVPGWGRSPEGGHSSILAWRIPWTEEPGRLQSMGSQGVGHDWVSTPHWLSLPPKCFLNQPISFCSPPLELQATPSCREPSILPGGNMSLTVHPPRL